MKVLMINGSPRAGGNTSIALGEMEKIFDTLKAHVDDDDKGRILNVKRHISPAGEAVPSGKEISGRMGGVLRDV